MGPDAFGIFERLKEVGGQPTVFFGKLLFQGDNVVGTDHLRTPVEAAIQIMAGMRGFMSGMAIPHMVIDAPGGGGKVPFGPQYIETIDDESVTVKTYRGETIVYPQPKNRDCRVPYDDVFFAGEAEDDDSPTM